MIRKDLETDYEKLIKEWEKSLNTKLMTLDMIFIAIVAVTLFILFFGE